MKPKTTIGKTTTWYKQDPIGIKCVCGSNSGYPITSDWWWEHVGPFHRMKHWIKRRFKR